jgi:ABC-2 type transport system permease protein
LNIFVTPLKISEFLFSTVLLGFIRIVLVGVVMSGLAYLLYAFNIFAFGFYIIPFVLELLLFGWILGIFTTAIIMRYGTSAQVLAFGFIVLIQPFSAVFYPVSALPQFVQFIAYIFPSTYVFEGMRAIISSGTIPWFQLLMATLVNIIYLISVLFLFKFMFAKVKEKGRLMKLD